MVSCLTILLGSSPRVRGTPTAMMCVSPMMGIIPACAGNTSRMRSRVQAPRDHPRVCGEHKGGQSFDCRQQGSSPRVRGTPDGFLVRQIPAGIIPACAGNTMDTHALRVVDRDHPRVCGEHWERDDERDGYRGSSPRVRGTPDFVKKYLDRVGIIPACAGNTVIKPTRFGGVGDHPRVCGEHIFVRCTIWDTAGSSPRVRGTRAELHKNPPT